MLGREARRCKGSASAFLDSSCQKANLRTMKYVHALVLFGSIPILTQCGPESMLNPAQEVNSQPIIPKGPETAFVNDPGGSRITYNDNHGENTFRLKKTHLYQFASLSRNRKSSDTRAGVWTYQKTGSKTGVLTFDVDDVWTLKFTTPHRAIAKNNGDSRSYTFEFEWE
jgi:hypothetical protein